MLKKLTLILCLLILTACGEAASSEELTMNYPYDRPLNIAHRGARSVAPENTVFAAQRGFELGADMWELDVHLTADETLILIHDDDLKRTTNAQEVFPDRRPWLVEDFTLAELKTLDAGSWFLAKDPFDQIRSGQVSAAALETISVTPLPTLQEALQYTKDQGWTVNVEIKDLAGEKGDALITPKTVSLIEEMDMVDQVIISSFNHEYLKEVKQLNPAIRTAALTDDKGLMRKPAAEIAAYLESLGVDAVNPGIKTIKDYAVIAALREAGFDVYVWTVNDEDVMIRLINAGVSGIITDYPQLLTTLLQQN